MAVVTGPPPASLRSISSSGVAPLVAASNSGGVTTSASCAFGATVVVERVNATVAIAVTRTIALSANDATRTRDPLFGLLPGPPDPWPRDRTRPATDVQ